MIGRVALSSFYPFQRDQTFCEKAPNFVEKSAQNGTLLNTIF
jgi:hypothetical protein